MHNCEYVLEDIEKELRVGVKTRLERKIFNLKEKTLNTYEKIHYMHKLVVSIQHLNYDELLENPAVQTLLEMINLKKKI